MPTTVISADRPQSEEGVFALISVCDHERVEKAPRGPQGHRRSREGNELVHNNSLQRPVTIKCSSQWLGLRAAELGR